MEFYLHSVTREQRDICDKDVAPHSENCMICGDIWWCWESRVNEVVIGQTCSLNQDIKNAYRDLDWKSPLGRPRGRCSFVRYEAFTASILPCPGDEDEDFLHCATYAKNLV